MMNLPLVDSIPPQFHALHNKQSGFSALSGSGGIDFLSPEFGHRPTTTTLMPIICLMEVNSPKCREHAFNVPAPKFAPNYKFPRPPPADLQQDETG
jgi:hypothetical protein